MGVYFLYEEERDIDCLISKGPGSVNQPGLHTRTYEALLHYTSNVTNRDKVKGFIRQFVQDNKIIPRVNASLMQLNWNAVASAFDKRANNVFGIDLPIDLKAYLTVTGRFPYNVALGYFFVPANATNANAAVMHELWHFYTWYRFGANELGKIGVVDYNIIKEALTVILNAECVDLMGGAIDQGYPQHRGIREKILASWEKTQNIETVWRQNCCSKGV